MSSRHVILPVIVPADLCKEAQYNNLHPLCKTEQVGFDLGLFPLLHSDAEFTVSIIILKRLWTLPE
jgi:hypothetical protein